MLIKQIKCFTSSKTCLPALFFLLIHHFYSIFIKVNKFVHNKKYKIKSTGLPFSLYCNCTCIFFFLLFEINIWLADHQIEATETMLHSTAIHLKNRIKKLNLLKKILFPFSLDYSTICWKNNAYKNQCSMIINNFYQCQFQCSNEL